MVGKAAISGFRTILRYAAGTVVGKLTNIAGIEMKADTIDVTSHASPGGFKEFIAGLKDAGEVPIEGNFSRGDSGQVALLASYESGAVEEMEIEFPDGSIWAFDAIVTSYGNATPMTDKIGFKSSLKITGQPEYTAGSGS